jgi:hypothetical protein
MRENHAYRRGAGHRRPIANLERRAGKTEHPTSNIEHPTSNEQKPVKAAKCDIKATTKRVDRQPIATPMRPQCGTKATPMRPQSHLHATRKPSASRGKGRKADDAKPLTGGLRAETGSRFGLCGRHDFVLRHPKRVTWLSEGDAPASEAIQIGGAAMAGWGACQTPGYTSACAHLRSFGGGSGG